VDLNYATTDLQANYIRTICSMTAHHE